MTYLFPIAACVSACVTACITAGGVWLVRGSTAVPAALWSAAACLALAAEMGARVSDGLIDPAAAAAARLAVVSLSLCPAMSLLGAKRPQQNVWQLIVATLAVVLVLPAVSARLVRPGSMPDVHMIERFFLPLLVIVGWLNFVGTRRAAAATCGAAGQLMLMRGFLPGVVTTTSSPTGDAIDAAAAGLILLGATWAAVQALASAARRNRPATGTTTPREETAAAFINPPFLALRETLGAAWSLRIAERFDTVAAARGWPCRLRFGGLVSDGDPADTHWHRDALRAFRALLRRFVTDAWLARHGWRDAAGGLHAGQEPS